MPKYLKEKTEVEEDQELTEVEEFSEDDYGFVIGANGELKAVVFPDILMEDPPIEVRRILKILGIKNIHQMEPRTLH